VDRDGLPPYPTKRPRWPRPRGLPGGLAYTPTSRPGGASASRPPHRPRTPHVLLTTRAGVRLPGRPRWARTPTLLVDTYDISQASQRDRGRRPGAARPSRLDSGDLSVLAAQSRLLLDSLGATETKIVVSGDLRRVLDRRAGRRAGGQLRRGHRRGQRVRRADRGAVYKLSRWMAAGGQAQRTQGHGGRPQDRDPAAQADGHGDRGDCRLPGYRTGSR